MSDAATAGSETSGQPERREGLGTLIELSHRFIDLNGRLMGNSPWRRCNRSWLIHALNETDGKRILLHLAAIWNYCSAAPVPTLSCACRTPFWEGQYFPLVSLTVKWVAELMSCCVRTHPFCSIVLLVYNSIGTRYHDDNIDPRFNHDWIEPDSLDLSSQTFTSV